MRRPFRWLLAILALSSIAAPRLAGAQATLDRQIRFPGDALRLAKSGEATLVTMRGAMAEFRPGRPDVPWLSERVELPTGTRVAAVEVVDLETAPLASGVRLLPAIAASPGLGPIERSAADPELFGAAAAPTAVVELGAQGGERGVAVAYLRVSPVRWTPVSGVLERVTSITVRLRLENADLGLLRRERIVPEWEDRPVSAARAVEPLRAAYERRPQPHKPTQLPSVEGSPVQYVIITDEVMQPEFERLATWKTQTGVPAVVRTMSFIRANYPYGSDDAERVRMFIRDAYVRWGTRFVLLGGDTEVIPTRYGYTQFYGGNDIATDLYFSALDGNWNADGDSIYGEGYYSTTIPGDGADLLPETYVGRAPTKTADEARQFVDRTLFYARTPVQDYLQSVLFFSEVLFPQEWSPGMITSLDGAELSEEVLPILQLDPNIRYARLYENHLDPRWEPGALLETKQAVVDSLNRGYNIAVHIGHGYRNTMSVGNGSLINQDAFTLKNGQRYINLYAINCTSNAIDFPSIGEAFILAPGGGAVTNIGSTNLDFPTAGRVYQTEYFRLVFEDSVTAIGEAQARAKIPYVAFSSYDGVNRWTQMTLLMLGDPELRLWTGKPRTLQVSHAASMPAGDSLFNVTVSIGGVPLYGARVTAFKDGLDYRSVTTDGAGLARVPFRPDSAGGDFTLTVTGYDCLPHQVTVPVGAAAQPVLALGDLVVDDDDVGGTSGNGDGRLDAGETVDLYMPVRNTSGIAATSVLGTLQTSDPEVTLLTPNASYGALAVGASALPSPGFRVSVPVGMVDQKEIAFTLALVANGSFPTSRRFQVVSHAPELRHYGHSFVETSGDGDLIPEVGETLTYTFRLRNDGSGPAEGVTAVLRRLGASTVPDSTAGFGDIPAGVEQAGDPIVLVPSSLADRFELRVSDATGLRLVKTVDLTLPTTPGAPLAFGAATGVRLQWLKSPSGDLFGYNVYRGTAPGGPFDRVNPVPTERTAYYLDAGLAPLTRYYYRLAAVDSSGNESARTAVVSVSTNPPTHAIFPVQLGRETPAAVAVDHLFPGTPLSIVAGADLLYAFRADGSAPVDADGGESTYGDFTRRGSYYAAGPSIGDIDGDGFADVVAPSWDSTGTYAFDLDGTVKPGWPVSTAPHAIWSGASLGDLDNDGKLEAVWGTNGNRIYAVRWNGAELIDGDANASTQGVFKVLGASFNFGTAAIADLDGNGQRDIVYGGADGFLHAWRANGTNLPGFPRFVGGSISASVAVGGLDGAGDPQLDIVVLTSQDSLIVVRADGSRRWGTWFRSAGTSKAPSPALADINNDGFLDIVVASTNGAVWVYNRNGGILAGWNGVRYSALTGSASESSPVVADINGDGWNDIVMGDENRELTALSGANASVLPGFPIRLEAEIRGVPALADIDADGMTEIVVSGWDRHVYVWDYDFPFSPAGTPPWPQFQHDARRTGFSGSPAFVDVEPGRDPVALAPAALEFAPPSPNPARSAARLRFGVPADAGGEPYELSVYDLAGRLVRAVERGTARPGRHSASWDLRDAGGAPVGGGIYFVRLSLGARAETRKLIVLR